MHILDSVHCRLTSALFPLPSALLLAEINATTIFLLGLLLVVGFILRGSRKRRSSSRLQPVAQWGKSPEAAEKTRRGPPDDLARWEVQMHDLARDLSGQLDSKIAILQILIRDAQQQADRLEAALGRSPGHSTARRQMARLSGEGGDRRQAEIYRLSDDGYSSTAIAHEVGVPVGEVELILSLRAKIA